MTATVALREARSAPALPAIASDPSETNPLSRERASLPGADPCGAIVHSRCGSWWTGVRTSHCGGCHLSFSSTTAFDRHQRGHVDGCSPPASVGLVAVPKKWGVCWSWPSDGRNPFAGAGF